MDLNTVVVGYDGSPDAEAALDAAAVLAGDNATVHVIVAYEPPSAAEMAEWIATMPDEFKTVFDSLEVPRRRLRDAEARLAPTGVKYTGSIAEGKPAAAILDAAEDLQADLVVVGSRGLGRGTRFLRGSVSSRIANHAHCSFLVVHAPEQS